MASHLLRFIIPLLIFITMNPLFALPGETDTTTAENISYNIPKVKNSIKVDAILDDAIWDQAVRINANIEVQPGENITAPVKTEALLAYNERHIFVAIIAYDPEPDKIRARYCDRDNLWDDDWVLILFDTFNDQRRTYDFTCNPLGIQADMIETTSGGGGAWDAIWESDGRITDKGYIVEMAIPFSSLNFPRISGDQIWGFDVVRSYPRNVRHHIGAFPRDRDNNCYMCQSPKLIGFNNVSPGKNIEIDPTFNVTVAQERSENDDGSYGKFKKSSQEYNPGITAHWGLTPNLTLSGTINPDFSNIEADILQLDINNQFALYYPEKRPFFLESADFFSTPLDAVHTRTLADPNWGVKLAGKEGIHTVGFFTVQDNITNFLFPGSEGSSSGSRKLPSYGSAFRYKLDVSESSNIGILVTDREAEDYFNRSGGIDADFKFTKKDRIRVQALASATQYPDSVSSEFEQSTAQFNGSAIEGLYVRDTKNYELYAFHKQVDENFRADLGFITQAGIKYSEIGGEYKFRNEADHWYNWLSFGSSLDYQRDYNGQMLFQAWTTRMSYRGPMDSHSSFYGSNGKNRYDGKEFNIARMHGCYGFRPMSSLFLHIFAAYGDQIDYANTRLGTRFKLNPSMEVSLGLHLKAELDHTYEKLNVNAGQLYTANISRIKLIYQINKEMFLRGIVQYVDYQRDETLYLDEVEPETKDIFTQFLFSYKINPQTVFFLGYSDNYYGNYTLDVTQTNRTLFTKIGYAFVP